MYDDDYRLQVKLNRMPIEIRQREIGIEKLVLFENAFQAKCHFLKGIRYRAKAAIEMKMQRSEPICGCRRVFFIIQSLDLTLPLTRCLRISPDV